MCSNTIGGSCLGNDIISGIYTLTNSLYVSGNLQLTSGSYLTLNGFSIAVTGTFNSLGATIDTGISTLSPGSSGSGTGANNANSVGGAGGGGGGGGGERTIGEGGGGGGGATIAAGGSGGSGNPGGVGGGGGTGTAPSIPTLTTSNVILYCNNIQKYLTGAPGGGGGGMVYQGLAGGRRRGVEIWRVHLRKQGCSWEDKRQWHRRHRWGQLD